MAGPADYKTLIVKREGSRLYVTINRPESKNAINHEVVEDLTNLTRAISTDRTLRALILRGSQGTFCAGGDIRGFKESFSGPAPAAGEADPIAENNRRFGDFLILFNSLPQTVVGLIEGAAFGGGLGLVCVTDIAISLADTKFALSETGLGVVPAQIAPFVVQRIGITQARRIALSGARFDGRHAKELGLVHFIANNADELDATLKRVLNDIGRCAPGANAATKQVLLDSLVGRLPQVLDAASEAFAAQLRGPEGQEGVKAFLEKRPAPWVERVE
jgi:isohexenylglutaconyl-CoA hydratase